MESCWWQNTDLCSLTDMQPFGPVCVCLSETCTCHSVSLQGVKDWLWPPPPKQQHSQSASLQGVQTGFDPLPPPTQQHSQSASLQGVKDWLWLPCSSITTDHWPAYCYTNHVNYITQPTHCSVWLAKLTSNTQTHTCTDTYTLTHTQNRMAECVVLSNPPSSKTNLGPPT